MTTALFVGIRIVANPVSNALQKRLADARANPVGVIAVTHALLTLACLPFLFHLPLASLPIGVWRDMAVCAVLAVAGNVLLVYALKHGDLSVLGSVNAYKAVLSLVLAVFLVGEVPSVPGLFGVVLIVWGSAFVVDRADGQRPRSAIVRFFRERGVQYRFAALACSATEAVFLKHAVVLSSPLTVFLLWCALGLLVSLAAVVVLAAGEAGAETMRVRQHWRAYAWLAVTTGVVQLTTLLTFGVMPVGYSLALFQLSTLISVFLGYRYFQEQNIARRLVGSILMIIGAVIIAMLGTRG